MLAGKKCYTVRQTMAADWHILKFLRLEALKDSPQAFTVSYAEAIKHQDAEWQMRAAQQTACRYLLAFDEYKAVGMLGMITDELHECHVVAMWVKPKDRAQGVAALLMESIKILAKQQGHDILQLRVANNNLRVFKFYQKQGFKVDATALSENMQQSSLKMYCDLR